MRVEYRPTDDEVRARRKAEYLKRWPIEKQLEAHSEAVMGRPEKLRKMKEDFSEIREVLPFFREEEVT